MNRPEVYSGEMPRSYDLLKGWRDATNGLGWAMAEVLGGSILAGAFGSSPLLDLDSSGVRVGITTGLSGAATAGLEALLNGFNFESPTGFNFNMASGEVYVFSEVDNIGNIIGSGGTPTGYGDIAADTTTIVQQCAVPASTTQVAASAPAGSTVLWFLIYVTPTQIDTTDADDPNISASSPYNADLPYYNSANPQAPLAGPGGTNPPTQNSTSREPGGTIGIATNSATTVSATIPNALTVPSGATPLYVGYLISTDIIINPAHVWAAGIGTCPKYTNTNPFPVAKFVRGLTEQHHLGVAGGAPQIDGAAEWLPLNTVPNNDQKIDGLKPNFATPAGGSFPTTDYATVNSQLILNPAPTAYSFNGTESDSGQFSAVSISSGKYTNWNPIPGGPIVLVYTGVLNFTTTSAVAGDQISYVGNTHSGTALAANVGQLAGNNDPGGGVGLFSANPNASSPLTQFDFTFTLASSLTDDSYSVPFTLVLIGH